MSERYLEVWDKIAEKYAKDKVTSRVENEHKKIFNEALIEGTLLDVGCGIGKHLQYLAKKKYFATGLDISLKMIEQAKKAQKRKNIKANLIIGSAVNLPFCDDSFDNVICMGNSIGAIPGGENRIRALKEILRVAKHNILLELLKSDTLHEVWAQYWFCKEDEKYLAKRWNEEEIAQMLTRTAAGLKVNIAFRIKKGRKSRLEKYLFYLLIEKKHS